ncbi:nicotinamide riboside transporter PnuC [Limosilactobacillus fermentum]|uniref:nicotinamide riboside transporter PnuC n=1 Tax=Limosilactobacillus fermentum TaxID=1613 RepID=UPI001E3011D3|nr:nicotinamide riboside transporter PnuC [Limosilactobacillus fermentum]MCD5424690.1 nicotinamide riboside transporter PnuC [Limosilactobacillus fermentum]
MQSLLHEHGNIVSRAIGLAFSPKQIYRAIFKMGRGRTFYLFLLLLLQVVSFFLYFANGTFSLKPDTSVTGIIGLLAGITGIISVVICADGEITNYFWGILNNIAYIYVSFANHLYGEVYLNLYFFILAFIGIYEWTAKNIQTDSDRKDVVQVKELTKWGWVALVVLVLIGWFALGSFLKQVPFLSSTLDPHPWIDSISVVVQVFAQLLMVLRYGSSQWLLWIIADVAELVLWTINFNPIIIALWLAYLINALYGYYVWTYKLQKEVKA